MTYTVRELLNLVYDETNEALKIDLGRDSDVSFNDGQGIVFGTDDDAKLSWDGSNDRLHFDFSSLTSGTGVFKDVTDVTTGYGELIRGNANNLTSGYVWQIENEAGSAATIEGVSDNAGKFQITDTAHGLTTGDKVHIEQNGGDLPTGALGYWFITVNDANTFTLNNSTFVSGWSSGGTWDKVDPIVQVDGDTMYVTKIVGI